MSAQLLMRVFPPSIWFNKLFKNAYMANDRVGNSIKLMTKRSCWDFCLVVFVLIFILLVWKVHMQVLHKTYHSEDNEIKHFMWLWRLAFDLLMRLQPQFSIRPLPIFIKLIKWLCWIVLHEAGEITECYAV